MVKAIVPHLPLWIQPRKLCRSGRRFNPRGLAKHHSNNLGKVSCRRNKRLTSLAFIIPSFQPGSKSAKPIVALSTMWCAPAKPKAIEKSASRMETPTNSSSPVGVRVQLCTLGASGSVRRPTDLDLYTRGAHRHGGNTTTQD